VPHLDAADDLLGAGAGGAEPADPIDDIRVPFGLQIATVTVSKQKRSAFYPWLDKWVLAQIVRVITSFLP
jgi:hypothetical protein